MRDGCKGFGLIELMVAMTLGLVMSLALTQMFISSKDTYLSQTASANLQEDARFVLNKVAQDIRMVGTFGCLASVTDASDNGDFAAAFKAPITWQPGSRTLTLITASVDRFQGESTWTVQTDCSSSAKAYSQSKGAGELSFPVYQQVYSYNARRAELTLNSRALISHVSDFSVLFGVASGPFETSIARYVESPGDPALIRSVRINLTLTDPVERVKEQTFSVVSALRNRLP
jgi:type IV pilus assembly protein PilW